MDLVLYGPYKPEGSGLAIANSLIIRYLSERSARFYTEENLGCWVYTEPDIHCSVASSSEYFCGTEPDGCREKKIMNSVTTVLRFIFGAVLAGCLALWGGMPFLLSVIFVMAVGIVAAVWGDKFLLGFMSVMRYLR